MDFKQYYQDMIDTILHPNKTIPTFKKNSLQDGLTYVALGAIVSGFMTGILSLNIMGAIGGAIMAPIGLAIVFMIWGVLYWIWAKIMGLQAELGNFLGTMGVVVGALVLIGWVPILGMLVGLYGLYLNYVALTKAFGMTNGRALIVIGLPLLLMLIITALMLAFVIAILGSLGLGALGGLAAGKIF